MVNLFIKLIYQGSRFLFLIFKPMTNGVRLLMVRDSKVLLVKHVYEDKWYLPGGLVDKGETLDQAIRREAREEVGASLYDLQLYGAYTSFKDDRTDHITVFLSQDFSLNGQSDHEIEALAFYPLDDIPETTSDGSKHRIEDYVRGETQNFGSW
jgi:ADP-ribose pyrophosphatase YjhB (NUDIX family)